MNFLAKKKYTPLRHNIGQCISDLERGHIPLLHRNKSCDFYPKIIKPHKDLITQDTASIRH